MIKPSISDQMAKGATRERMKILALLKDHSPKQNHKFCPPTLSFDQSETDKTRRISKAAI